MVKETKAHMYYIFVYSLCLFIHSFVRSVVCLFSFVCPSVHSFVRSFVSSFIHSLLYIHIHFVVNCGEKGDHSNILEDPW